MFFVIFLNINIYCLLCVPQFRKMRVAVKVMWMKQRFALPPALVGAYKPNAETSVMKFYVYGIST